MTPVMGSGEWTGYIAESLDAQNSRFDFRGGGATTAMNDSLGFSCHGCIKGEAPKDLEPDGIERGGPRTVRYQPRVCGRQTLVH